MGTRSHLIASPLTSPPDVRRYFLLASHKPKPCSARRFELLILECSSGCLLSWVCPQGVCFVLECVLRVFCCLSSGCLLSWNVSSGYSVVLECVLRVFCCWSSGCLLSWNVSSGYSVVLCSCPAGGLSHGCFCPLLF